MESSKGMGIGESDTPRRQRSLYICIVRRRILYIVLFIPERMRNSAPFKIKYSGFSIEQGRVRGFFV